MTLGRAPLNEITLGREPLLPPTPGQGWRKFGFLDPNDPDYVPPVPDEPEDPEDPPPAPSLILSGQHIPAQNVVRLTWNYFSPATDSYEVYEDGVSVGNVYDNSWDVLAQIGSHSYQVAALDTSFTELIRSNTVVMNIADTDPEPTNPLPVNMYGSPPYLGYEGGETVTLNFWDVDWNEITELPEGHYTIRVHNGPSGDEAFTAFSMSRVATWHPGGTLTFTMPPGPNGANTHADVILRETAGGPIIAQRTYEYPFGYSWNPDETNTDYWVRNTQVSQTTPQKNFQVFPDGVTGVDDPRFTVSWDQPVDWTFHPYSGQQNPITYTLAFDHPDGPYEDPFYVEEATYEDGPNSIEVRLVSMIIGAYIGEEAWDQANGRYYDQSYRFRVRVIRQEGWSFATTAAAVFFDVNPYRKTVSPVVEDPLKPAPLNLRVVNQQVFGPAPFLRQVSFAVDMPAGDFSASPFWVVLREGDSVDPETGYPHFPQGPYTQGNMVNGVAQTAGPSAPYFTAGETYTVYAAFRTVSESPIYSHVSGPLQFVAT